MPALDTSVLVRHLVEDDARQAAAARRLLRAAVASGQSVFVPVSVTLELECVLRKRYRFSKERIIGVLSALLSAADLVLEAEGAVEGALALYADGGGGGFSDCLHVSLAFAAGHTPWWTFDRRAARLPGARRLATTRVPRRAAVRGAAKTPRAPRRHAARAALRRPIRPAAR